MSGVPCGDAGLNTNQIRARRALSDLLTSMVTERHFASGVQIYVEHGGTVLLDDAFGTSGGAPLDAGHLHPAYCATKPLIALGIALLLERDVLSLDAHMAELVPGTAWLAAETTVADLLVHRAGLRHPTATAWRMTPPDERQRLLVHPPHRSDSYSEIAAWYALGKVIEHTSQCDVDKWLTDEILKPLGIADDVRIDPESALDARRDNRIRVPIGGLPAKELPLYSERLPAHLAEAHAYFGGLATASGLGRLYTAVKNTINGRPTAGLPDPRTLNLLLSCRRTSSWDHTLRRNAAFSGGFMTELSDQGLSKRTSATAIGHTAGMANTLAYADPVNDIAFALYCNGVALTHEDMDAPRLALTDLVYRTLLP